MTRVLCRATVGVALLIVTACSPAANSAPTGPSSETVTEQQPTEVTSDDTADARDQVVTRKLPPTGNQKAGRQRCNAGRTRGDFDGDGKREVVVLYAPRAGHSDCLAAKASGRRRIAVVFATGRRFDHRIACSLREFRAFRIPEGCHGHGAADLNGDGRDELFLNVGGGSAHGDAVAAYVVGRRGLQRIDLAPPGNPRLPAANREDLEFAAVGSAGYPTWIDCRRAADRTVFVATHAVAPLRPERRWRIVEDIYFFDGTALHYEETRRFTSGDPFADGVALETFCGHQRPWL